MTAVFHPLVVIPVSLAFLLFAIGSHGPQVAHLTAELLLAITALLIALAGWRTSFLTASHLYRNFAVGYLWVAVLQLVHALSYPSLPLANLITPAFHVHLGHGTRVLEAIVMLMAPYFLGHPGKSGRSFVMVGATAFVIVAISWLLTMAESPDIEARLHTALRLVAAFLVAGATLYLFGHRARLDRHCRNCLLAAYVLFLFTQVVFDAPSLADDVLKLFSLWLLFAAAAGTSLQRPFRITATGITPYDAYPDPTIVVDRDGVIYQANAAAQQFATSGGTELTETRCHGLFHDTAIAPDLCPICQSIRTCTDTTSFERPFRIRDRYYQVTLSPLYTGPQSVHIVQINRDVTASRRAEQALRDSESKYRALLEHAADGIVLLDNSGIIIETSQRLLEISHYARNQLLGRPVLEFVPLQARFALRRAQRSLARNGRATYNHAILIPGSMLPVETTVAAIAVNGSTLYLAALRDVRERSCAERALRASEVRSRAIFENVGVGICVCTPEGVVMESNRALETMLGSGPTLRGRSVLEMIHPDDRPGTEAWASIVASSSTQPMVMPLRYLGFGEELCWGETTVTSVVDSEGHILFSIVMVKDITEAQKAERARRADEAEVRRARRAAEEASTTKTRFLATASHDLRQPIQAIHLLLFLLHDRPLPAEVRDILDRIGGAVKGLSGMLDGLLDISKLDAGIIRPELETFDFAPLMKQIANEFQPLAESKGLRLCVMPCSVQVHSDHQLLGRVLRNLVANAVRYTSSGRILFGCRRRGDHILVQVTDTGPGIAPNEHSRIFREFHQVGNEGRDRREGLGLGLAIVERLCRLLSHPILLRSEPGRGSTFTVRVPISHNWSMSTPASQLVLPMPREDALILVVEDDVDIRESMRMLLEGLGFRVAAASDLAGSVQSMNAAGEAPALIIADYRLGKETGIDVITRIRALHRDAIPAIIITGDVAAEPVNRARLLGIQLLHKPVTSEQLGKAIETSLHAQRQKPRRRSRRRSST